MNRRNRNITFITAVIIMLIAAVSYEQSFYEELSNTTISRQAQRYISSKSLAIDKYIEVLSEATEAGENLWELPISNNYNVFVSSGAHPIYWNTNRISPEHIPFSQQLTCHRIDNAWFLYKSTVAANKRIDVLVNIKNDYSINNEYFDNEDISKSELSQYSISEKPKLGYNIVYSINNQPLFYFAKTELNKHNKRQSLNATIIYFMLFLIILSFLSQWHKKNIINLISLLSFGFLFILGVHFYHFIPIFDRSPLFDPSLYSNTGLMDNLGMMSLGAILWLVFTYQVNRTLKYYQANNQQVFGGILIAIIFFYIIIQRYIDVIQNTDINLQIFRIRMISKETFWVYAILLSYIGGWGQLVTRLIANSRQQHLYLYPILALVLTIPLLLRCPFGISAAILYLYLNILSQRKRQHAQYLLLHLLGACMLLAGVISFITETETLKKENIQKEELISTLPSTLLQERDFEVEERLLDIWNQMQEDQTLQNIPRIIFNTPELYANYLKKHFFSNQLDNYDLQVVICHPYDYLQIVGSTTPPNCYAYFENMLEEEGERIKNTGFYWQNNNNGRVSYLGFLKMDKNTTAETTIFIDLESQILSEGQGYPEMLRDNNNKKHNLPSRFSYARYVNDHLISSSGDFRYAPSDKWIPEYESNYYSFNFNKERHLVYTISDNSCFVLSEPRQSILSPLYAFIYTFLMVYLSFLTVYMITHNLKIKLQRTISNDIRFTIYGVLLISLILVGSASVFFPLKIYKQNQENMINEKSQSFLSSIAREFSGIDRIENVSQSSLQSLLTSLSNTLYKDVNIYDLNGKLYASSRPQLFNLNLQGSMMNHKAYNALHNDNMMSQMQDETIGDNEYTASYFLISNSSEEPLAYINVPFFNSRQDLKKSIYDYLVLLLNIYLLLIILVLILTYISVTAITKPLLFIQEGLGKMKLGSNVKINYHRNDEIGHLVEKYNVMVDELNASVKQLAQSEREGAWKRMARQIAHEIKNPLTPMKLSIQHLMRTKNADPDIFDEYFKKTANTLVEQIDNLSNIATSFSTFAKISDGNPEYFNLNERIENVVTLFTQSGNNITINESHKDLQIYIDKDHFIQIFNNLIKNAIQSVPDERKAIIEISITSDNNKVTIYVKDNGCGIDKETSEKIFQPNFTTKNSGMGLGLAISQKMANNAQGEITFKNNNDQGTTFMVTLPINLNSTLNSNCDRI